MILELGMQHRRLVLYKINKNAEKNDDTGLTLNYFTTRSNLAAHRFESRGGRLLVSQFCTDA